MLAQAYLMDSLIKTALETVDTKLYRTPNPTQGEQICIIAVGGYGRRISTLFRYRSFIFTTLQTNSAGRAGDRNNLVSTLGHEIESGALHQVDRRMHAAS